MFFRFVLQWFYYDGCKAPITAECSSNAVVVMWSAKAARAIMMEEGFREIRGTDQTARSKYEFLRSVHAFCQGLPMWMRCTETTSLFNLSFELS